MFKKINFSNYLPILLFPNIVFASNFGNLPSVIPIFFIGFLISIGVAIAKATSPENKYKGFNFGPFFGYFFLGTFISLIVTIILFSFTF